MIFSDTRPEAQAVADTIMTALTEQHGKGVHIADLMNGVAVAQCMLLQSYGDPDGVGGFLRALGDRYDADPLRRPTSTGNRTRN